MIPPRAATAQPSHQLDDSDGNEARLNVQVWAFDTQTSSWKASWLINTGPSVHGLYFWLKTADVNIFPAKTSAYYFMAMDETGLWSTKWTVATPKADGSCTLA